MHLIFICTLAKDSGDYTAPIRPIKSVPCAQERIALPKVIGQDHKCQMAAEKKDGANTITTATLQEQLDEKRVEIKEAQKQFEESMNRLQQTLVLVKDI
jgi:hypothetical protein